MASGVLLIITCKQTHKDSLDEAFGGVFKSKWHDVDDGSTESEWVEVFAWDTYESMTALVDKGVPFYGRHDGDYEHEIPALVFACDGKTVATCEAYADTGEPAVRMYRDGTIPSVDREYCERYYDVLNRAKVAIHGEEE